MHRSSRSPGGNSDRYSVEHTRTGMAWVWKTLCCPILLPYEATRLYLGGCIHVYMDRMGGGGGSQFQDSEFPANTKTVGPIHALSPADLQKQLVWKRVADVVNKGTRQTAGTKLFAEGISPHDICQGQIGDCWLLSTLACLASRKGAIEFAFITAEYNQQGRYRLQLFDVAENKFVRVEVDDLIPCSRETGRPLFANPNGDAWVVLLEKAMAKFKGSYANLDGGNVMWAMRVLTGDPVHKYIHDKASGVWKRWELAKAADRHNPLSTNTLMSTTEQRGRDEMFDLIVAGLKKNWVMGASTGGGNDTQNIDGIVLGHAYSLIDAQEVEGMQLLRLRNPWGTFEWTGDWSDKSPMWQQHPKVAATLGFDVSTEQDDGTFWMSMQDFCNYFANVDVCEYSTDGKELDYNLDEDDSGCCGPCCACVGGCAEFWCLCKGCKQLYGGRNQTHPEPDWVKGNRAG